MLALPSERKPPCLSSKFCTAIKTGNGTFGSDVIDADGKALDVIELDEKEAKLIDRDGDVLQLKSDFDLEQLGEKAKADAIAKAMADVAASGEKAKSDALKKASKAVQS